MDDEDAARNHMSRYSASHHQTNSSSHRRKPLVQRTTYTQHQHVTTNYSDHGEDEEEPEEDEDEVISEDVDDDDEKSDFHGGIGVVEGSERYQKKRKWKALASGYKLAPSVAAPSGEWTEHTTFVLLDVWGDRFLQHGRKSLRSEEWEEVAKKVSQAARCVTTDTQCRKRLDTLKKKYKREKTKFEEISNYTSKWPYFKKMDNLMCSSWQQHGLSCGFDSGEYVFTNPNVYLNCSSGLDEMRDSPENSESSDGLPSKKVKIQENGDEGNSFRLLADSIQKFGEIHERIEENKMQQMRELEKMRIEFHRDLELQKRQILEHAQAEIEKIQQSYDDDDDDSDEIDVSAENLSE